MQPQLSLTQQLPTPLYSFSFSDISMEWMLATAALVMILSLALAWIATLIIYGQLKSLKKVFPATQNLIRAHIDYLMMAVLLVAFYFTCIHLGIVLPAAVIAILCFGVLYNPFGFILKAIDPKTGQADTLAGKILVCSGFLPATIGFGYASFAILGKLL